MARDPEILRTELVDRVAFRYSNYDTPLWARDNRTDGRWHVIGDGATQYLSLHPEAAWADLARQENLRTEEELLFVRTPMWALSVTQANLVDYSTFSKAEAAGFPGDALINDDQTQCQVEGKRLRGLGYAGVVAPCAALPGEICVTLFGRRVRARWGVQTKLASAIPCSIVAIGRPAPGLTAKVRYVGELHLGYEAYRERQALLGVAPPQGSDVDVPPRDTARSGDNETDGESLES